jgi:thioredoxin reductase
MAQRISKEEYEKQSSDYTKKALAELNEQLKNFNRKEVVTTAENEDVFEESDDDGSDEDYLPRKNKRRIIIETNVKNIFAIGDVVTVIKIIIN